MAQEYDSENVWHEIDNMNQKQREEYVNNINENHKRYGRPLKSDKKRKAPAANTTAHERRLLATKGKVLKPNTYKDWLVDSDSDDSDDSDDEEYTTKSNKRQKITSRKVKKMNSEAIAALEELARSGNYDSNGNDIAKGKKRRTKRKKISTKGKKRKTKGKGKKSKGGRRISKKKRRLRKQKSRKISSKKRRRRNKSRKRRR